MSGGDVALRFTWSTTHIEVDTFVEIPNTYVYIYDLIFFFVSSSRISFCCRFLFVLLWLTPRNSHSQSQRSFAIHIEYTHLIRFFRLTFVWNHTLNVCMRIFDTVWQARPIRREKKICRRFGILFAIWQSFFLLLLSFLIFARLLFSAQIESIGFWCC